MEKTAEKPVIGRMDHRFRAVEFDGDMCRAARALIGWSQKDLAYAAFVPVTVVKGLENGTIKPAWHNKTLIRLALTERGIEFIRDTTGRKGVLMRGNADMKARHDKARTEHQP